MIQEKQGSMQEESKQINGAQVDAGVKKPNPE